MAQHGRTVKQLYCETVYVMILFNYSHKTTYQKRHFGVIQAIRSGQVTCQELGQSNPSTRWGGSPT